MNSVDIFPTGKWNAGSGRRGGEEIIAGGFLWVVLKESRIRRALVHLNPDGWAF
jgi:hypothetical protein